MKYIFIVPVNAFVWSFVSLATVLLMFLAAIIRVLFPFDRRQLVLQHVYRFWAWMYLFLNPLWKVRMEGKMNIPPKKPLVMVSNHQSMIDILVIQQIPVYFKWVSKAENFRVPVLGWVLALNKNIPVDRAKGKSYLEMIRRAKEILALGSSVMIFPEGTRSKDGKISRFREGAFRIAQESHCGILPVVLDGTRDSIAKGEFLMKKRVLIRLRILPEIPYDQIKNLTTEEAGNIVHRVIEEGLGEMRSTISKGKNKTAYDLS